MLHLQEISKSFSKEKILSNINLEIQDGEFIVLVGPSGCGKTTLIRIIAGLEKQDSGQIILDGQDISSRKPSERNLSMVFQNYALYPHKTVYENIAFPLRIEGLDKQELDQKTNAIAEKLRLGNLLQRKPKELSGGQRQRVALARAMVKNPKIFLLDEPLSNLDAQLRQEMRREIFELHKLTKAIFIYVTHDQIEALTLAQRVVVLNQGEIQQISTPQEIYNFPQNTFVATFIGSPATNLLQLNTKEEYITGIRPEYFTLEPAANKKEFFAIELKSIELLGSEFLIHGVLDNKYNATNVLIPQNLIAKVLVNNQSKMIYEQFLNQAKENKIKPFVTPIYFDRDMFYYFNKQNGCTI